MTRRLNEHIKTFYQLHFFELLTTYFAEKPYLCKDINRMNNLLLLLLTLFFEKRKEQI